MALKTSEARRRAVRKYQEKNKDRIHKLNITIYDTKDPELWPWLTSRKETKGEVIRRLMHEEIERTGWQLGDK